MELSLDESQVFHYLRALGYFGRSLLFKKSPLLVFGEAYYVAGDGSSTADLCHYSRI